MVFDIFPESAALYLLGFLGLPTQLSVCAGVSRRLAALLSDHETSSTGAYLWQEAFVSAFWNPASKLLLSRARLPTEFCWQRECIRRLRFKYRHVQRVRHLAWHKEPYFVCRQGFAEAKLLEDQCLSYSYTVHRLWDSVDAAVDVSEENDTVAVVHGRASGVMPDEAIHGPEDAEILIQSVWRTRLPGARRLRYYEIEVLNTGLRGYISCGAVERRKARMLRNEGWQPGWRSGVRSAWSVGYHGDDGCLYPAQQDTFRDGSVHLSSRSEGKPFGPCFSAPQGSPDAALRPAGPPPLGAVLPDASRQILSEAQFPAAGTTRVCGMGIDLDRDSVFFTVDGALVGEEVIPGLQLSDCVPAVGLHSPGELVRINVGMVPFWFPIEAYSVDPACVPQWDNPRQWASED